MGALAGQALMQLMRATQSRFVAQVCSSSKQTPSKAQVWQVLQSMAASHAPAAAHVPLKHATLAGQTVPQAPQFASSFLTSTHSVPHLVKPAPHVVPQVPFEQTSPIAQALPHMPQLLGSSFMSTQTPLHFVVPPAHCVSQLLFEQT
jgi:hypothetical protein